MEPSDKKPGTPVSDTDPRLVEKSRRTATHSQGTGKPLTEEQHQARIKKRSLQKAAQEKQTPQPSGKEKDQATRFSTRFSSDAGQAAEIGMEKVERLEHRMTFVSLVVLGLVLAAALYFYFAFTQQISQVQETGAVKVQDLSREVQENITLLSAQAKQLNEKLGERMASLEDFSQKNRLLAEQVSQQAQQIHALTTELAKAKMGKKDVDALLERERQTREKNLALVVAEMERKIDTEADEDVSELREEAIKGLSDLATEIASLDQEMTQARRSLADLIEWQVTIVDRFAALGGQVRDMSDAKLDKKDLEQILSGQGDLVQDSLTRGLESMRQRVAALETQIVAFETELENLQKNGPDHQVGGQVTSQDLTQPGID